MRPSSHAQRSAARPRALCAHPAHRSRAHSGGIAIEEDGELLEGEWLLGARCLRSGDGVTFRADNGGDGLLLVVDGYDLLADESSLNHESAAYGLDELNLVSRGNPVVLEGPAVVDRSLPTDEPLQVRLRIEATCG